MAKREDPELSNPVRRAAFYAVLGLIFLRYSLVHEALTAVTGTNTFVLYLFAIPAAIGLLTSGGIPRAFAARQTKYWVAFVVWLFISVPFSTWKGESVSYLLDYLRTDLPMVFYVGGLALTWKECRLMFATIAVAGIVNVGVGRLITKDFGGGRMGLDFGIVSNPNDYAGHLLLIVPLILFLVIFPPKFMPVRWLIRLAGLAAIVTALWVILMTGSRGGLLALVAGSVFVFWKASTKVRIVAIFGLPLLAALLFARVSDPVRSRLASLTSGDSSSSADSDDNGTPGEAEESGKTRRFLLQESIKISFQHPLFGVGPGQFANIAAKAGGWHSTHNSFTQISSETGFPGLAFYLGAIVSSFLLLQRTWKQVRQRPELREISVACFFLSMSYVMFCSAIFFLNFGYFFYLPAATGLVVSLHRATQRELAALKIPARSIPGSPMQLRTPPRLTVPSAPEPTPRPRTTRAIRFNRYR